MSEQNQSGAGTATNTAPGVVMNPGWARLVLGVVGVLVTLSAPVMMVVAVVAAAKPEFQLFGFEVVALAAGVMAIWMARGRGGEGFGLGVLGIAGAIGGGCLLAYLAATQKHDFLHARGKLGHVPLAPWFYLRALCAGALVAVSALSVLQRNRKSYLVLIKGVALLVPALAIAGYGLMLAKNGQNPVGQLKGAAALAMSIGVLVSGIAMILMISVGGHLVIRAFEMGRLAKWPNSKLPNG